jgi:hypothetical protein
MTKGEEYEFSAEGNWSTAKDKPDATVDADGNDDGQGKLVGIVFEDYQLSEPIELGKHGSFTAPQDGDLLLRCQDAWHEIANNTGYLKVKLKVKGEGKPLPKPDATKAR